MSAVTQITSVSASNVSSVNVSDIFSSTYDFYQIVITDLDITANSINLDMRYLDSSGNEITSSYAYVRHSLQNTRSYLEQSGSSESDFPLINIDSTTAHNPALIIYIYDPLNTSFHTLGNYEGNTYNLNPNNYKIEAMYGGIALNDTQALSGVKFLVASGTIETINLKVFGFKES